jgi:hypothetical protein
MKNQTTNAIKTTIDSLKNIPNYNVKNVFGSEIKGPFKWVIFFIGPNNQAKEVRQMIAEAEEYGLNLNIIIIMIINSKDRKFKPTKSDEDYLAAGK